LLFLFGFTLFLSGALLFVVEPMFAKMALPQLGGTPAVWNVCLVTYQGLLLAGYAYSHAITKRLAPRGTSLLQVGFALAAFLVLPIRLPEMMSSPLRQSPVVWLVALLIVGLGLPFLVLSTYSSILQAWYAGTPLSKAQDPYTLYSASNLGSLIGLFSYPLLIEKHFGLMEQSRIWEWGYTVLVGLTAACAFSLWLAPQVQANSRAEGIEAAPRPTGSDQFKWLTLAFIPSSLMLGVTTALTTELPPIPLLWVLPLGLYLLSFILVFARKPITYHRIILETLPILLVVTGYPLISKAVMSPVFTIILYPAVLFLAAMACQGELALSRPSAGHLTRFYLCVSAGGVLGGLFNAIVAPVIFKSVAEFPIALFLLTLALALLCVQPKRNSMDRFDFLWPAALGIGAMLIALWLRSATFKISVLVSFLVFAGPLLACFSFAKRPLRFALGFGALLFASNLYYGPYGRLLLTDRSFFGVYQVSEVAGYRQLLHGSTVHGVQSLDPPRAQEPLAYYYRTGPIGQVFAEPTLDQQFREIAVVGLGAGSLACYGEPWRHFTFYEIDPLVEKIARDPRYFTFLRDCSPGTAVIVGDARLSLKDASAHKFNLLVVDAFTGDTVPTHLLTKEAIELYLAKLADHGLLAFNISNRYLDLRPVLDALAGSAGLATIVQEDVHVSDGELSRGKFASTWVLMAREESDLCGLTQEAAWHGLQGTSGQRLWTDDYSSIVNILHLGL
jgi:hypothetical protein